MKNWQQKIREGMNLIIEGCKENTEWCACHDCPFAELCDIIYEDSPSPYTTPDSYEEEGLFDEKQS
jgi:hypothetical protein